jgi:DNA-binding transcriptional regulator YhcF (GntR family)
MAGPILRVDLASTVPAYRQIVDGIRALLVAGAFAPGDQLPTVRSLAADLGLHHNTVAEAYRSLAAEGWLDLGRRRGATVLTRESPDHDPKAAARYGQRLREIVAEARAAGVRPRSLRAELATLIEGLEG